ncbi:LysR family transcriptional regulator [Pseudoalteromonas rubra]|uniref:LysR family transcriptional regulator n=1 Tax=Pseudoalteromonas rubra TaxID=43658 RepID=UPI000F767D94|nr:LysR family transcriptional regulator [Pseudoalteromonas rubra]
MKLADIQVLDAVANAQSLSAAAKRLYKSQPAVTQALKRLSDELGFALVTREDYRIRLTEQGKRFHQHAQKLLEQHNHLKILADEFSQGNEAKFRICYEPMCHQETYNTQISSTFKQFPSTELVISSGRRFVALEQVNAGAADLGLGPWFDLFHATGELESIAIGETKLGVVAKRGLLPKRMYYDELSLYPCLAMVESGFDFDSERLAYSRGLHVMKLDDVSTIKLFLSQGVGFALTSLNTCRQELESGELERIEIIDRQHEFTAAIHAFRRHQSHYGPVARHLWQQFTVLGAQFANGN